MGRARVRLRYLTLSTEAWQRIGKHEHPELIDMENEPRPPEDMYSV